MRKLFTSNSLKLIAIFSMTFDHIGKMMLLFYPYNPTIQSLESLFSVIGRFAFPLFLFLLIEGYYHTSNLKKYFLRLGFMASLIGLFYYAVGFIPGIKGTTYFLKFGNIFIDLLLSLAFITVINSKNLKTKFFSLLPLVYLTLFTLIQNDVLYINNETIRVLLAPFAPQYSFVTAIILLIYSSISWLRNYHYSKNTLHELTIDNAFRIETFDSRANIFSITIALLTIVMTLLTFVPNLNLNTNLVVNTYFCLSIIPLIFYNGNLGKNSKFLKSAYYLYYPVSLCIIYLIVYLTTII